MTPTQSEQIKQCRAILRRNRNMNVPDEETRKALRQAGYADGAIREAMND